MRFAVLTLLAIMWLESTAIARATESLEQRGKTASAGFEQSLRAQDTAAADAFHAALEAERRGDIVQAADRYKTCLERVPDFVPAMRHLGICLVEAGHRSEGIGWCRRALAIEDSADTRGALARALSSSRADDRAQSNEQDEAKRLAESALEKWRDDPWAALTACEVGISTNNLRLLQAGVDRLGATAPGDSVTSTYAAILLASYGRFDEAQSALDAARAVGLPEPQYVLLSKRLAAAVPWTTRIRRPALFALVGWVLGAVALIAVGALLSRATLRSAETMPPTLEGSVQGAKLRSVYRGVLAACCAYYFISLPFVLVIVVVAGGATVYGLMQVGYVPIKLAFIIVVSVGVTVFAAVRSLFIRRIDVDPGVKLDITKEPALRAVLDEVAHRIGTAPVDTVYLTPGTDVAVMERGGLSKRLTGRSERCLILGAGVLEGFRIRPFKAVLAHEYGHFSNKDTAGGSFAMAVRNSVHGMAFSLARGGAASWYNPAWLFLQGFHRVFLRISQGASRLQEILADRWAAFAFGSEAFEEGLRHVVSRSIRFPDLADATVNEAIRGSGVLSNVYRSRPREPRDEQTLDRKIREALDRDPSVYDSHPSPKDRFRWVAALVARGDEKDTDPSADAWSLFTDREAIERAMTTEVRRVVNARHGIPLKG
jgi:Zn-dependent protease with chaperone function